MKEKLRRIRFGIRFKFSVIMIAGVVFASALLALAVFNQQEKNIGVSIKKWGAAVLKSQIENTEMFLLTEQVLLSESGKELSPAHQAAMRHQMISSKKALTDYFSYTVRKEPGIDIAFLIRIGWNDMNVDWNRWDQALYRYYNRITGELFTVKSGRFDEQLKPSVFSYYMRHLDLDAKITHTTTVVNNVPKDYIILAMPVFRNSDQLYRDFLLSKRVVVATKDDAVKRENEKRRFRDAFMERIMGSGLNFEYDIVMEAERDRRIFRDILLDEWGAGMKTARRVDLEKECSGLIDARIRNGRISLADSKEALGLLQRKYGTRREQLSTGQKDETDRWKNFYISLKRNGIQTEADMSLDELALISYRMDLAGIQGFFLTRDVFYTEIDNNRKEIIDLILSVLIRCIVIALFFPTFLIRSISRLAEGAYEIGRGNLDTRIEVKGSDEIGRLADILNLMTKNLQRAREQMLEKQRMEEELKMAQEIQEALLPKEFPVIKGIEFGAYYSAQTESGGDYFDFIPIDENRTGITIADVSGHGVGSGLVMAMTRTFLHINCRRAKSIKELLSGMNEYLFRNSADNYFVTMFYGVLDSESRELHFSSAGHLPGIVLQKNSLSELPYGGIALGAVQNEIFDPVLEVKKIKLQKGDYLIQYTDGVVESMDHERLEYGLERFCGVLQKNYGKTPSGMIDAVVADINSFTGRIPQHDDITMIVIKIS